MRHLAVAVVIAFAPSIPRRSGACEPSPVNGGVHTLDAQHSNDAVAPSVTSADAHVYRPGPSAGCACESGGCGDSRWAVALFVAASDDKANEYELGYNLRVVGGQAPESLTIPTETVRSSGGELRLLLANNERSAFSFDLEIRAVDLNGNESAPAVITVVAEQ